MAGWLLGLVCYLAVMAVFLVAWSRGMPPPENNSRAVKRFEQKRLLRGHLTQTYKLNERSAEFEPLLEKLDRVR